VYFYSISIALISVPLNNTQMCTSMAVSMATNPEDYKSQ